MSNLALRLIFAAVAIPVVFFCLWWADWTRVALMVFLGAVGAWEWSRMVSKMYLGPNIAILAPLSAAALTLGWVFTSGHFFGLPPVPGLIGFIALIVVCLYIAIAFAKVNIENLFPWFLMQLGAPMYLGLWGGLSVLILGSGHGVEHSYKFILVMTAMWGCDTFAYFVGKFLTNRFIFGRHLMAPQISPKKTWEGAIGGTLFTMGWVAFWAIPVFEYSWYKGLVLGFVLAIAGQAGDLLMSALKRWSGTKDASQIFVGHGGVLDRGDSFYLAAPMLVLLSEFFNGILS